MDVFPIKGRNKCLIKLCQDGMREFIPITFEPSNLVDLLFDIMVVCDQVNQPTGPRDEVIRHRRKHLEETVSLRNKAEQCEDNAVIKVASSIGCSGRSESIS